MSQAKGEPKTACQMYTITLDLAVSADSYVSSFLRGYSMLHSQCGTPILLRKRKIKNKIANFECRGTEISVERTQNGHIKNPV